jgi:DNA-binding NarL/FixJ family response regulator
MPPRQESDGARAAARIRATSPDVGILLLSQHIELRECLDLVGTPGFGYLLKDRVLHLAEFDDALRRVAEGGSAIDPAIVRSLVGARRSSALDCLTPREVEVLGLVAEGHSNASLAATLFLSERTVMAHMRSVFTKLGRVDDGTTHRRVLASSPTWAHSRSTNPWSVRATTDRPQPRGQSARSGSHGCSPCSYCADRAAVARDACRPQERVELRRRPGAQDPSPPV